MVGDLGLVVMNLCWFVIVVDEYVFVLVDLGGVGIVGVVGDVGYYVIFVCGMYMLCCWMILWVMLG